MIQVMGVQGKAIDVASRPISADRKPYKNDWEVFFFY